MKGKAGVTMPRKAQINANRKRILWLLGEYKQLLTTDIWKEVQPHKLLQFTQRDLARLRNMELISCFPARPEAGNSEMYWQLRRRGAELISLRFANQYYRRPTLEQLELRGLQLELIRRIRNEGWQVIKPCTYSSVRPLPNPTRQYEILEYALGLLEYQSMVEAERREGRLNHQRRLDYEGKLYRLGLSSKTNDYVAYTEAVTQFRAIIFILTPPRATERFWQSRLQLYKTVARRIRTVGVFGSREEKEVWKAVLGKANFDAVTVEEVSQYLKKSGF